MNIPKKTILYTPVIAASALCVAHLDIVIVVVVKEGELRC